MCARYTYPGKDLIHFSTGIRVSCQDPCFTEWLDELRVFRHLLHLCIVLFYGTTMGSHSFVAVLVMEYGLGTPLEVEALTVVSGRGDAIDRCRLANGVCCALAYLNRHSIVRGDLKGSNALAEKAIDGCRAKLLDFGLRRELSSKAQQLGGAMRWMAPEVVLWREGSASFKADVFPCGRVLFWLLTGKKPLADMSSEQIRAAVKSGTQCALARPAMPFLSDEGRALCKSCEHLDPEARPNILEVRGRRPASLWSCLPLWLARPASL